MKNSVVIVDDHTLIAKALREIVSNYEQFEVLYECENGEDLMEQFKKQKTKPQIVLLDINMPLMNGFETAKWLKETHPNIKIMALSMQDDEQSVIKMIKNGAHGYLLKNTHPAALEQALLKLVQDGFYYPDWASKIVFSSLNSDTNSILTKLSDREKEFLKHSTSELTYKEISEKMFCSPRTVENYRDNLFEKLNLKTRVGLAVFAIKNGLE